MPFVPGLDVGNASPLSPFPPTCPSLCFCDQNQCKTLFFSKGVSETWSRPVFDKRRPKRRRPSPCRQIQPINLFRMNRCLPGASPQDDQALKKQSRSRDIQVFSKLVESAFFVAAVCPYTVFAARSASLGFPFACFTPFRTKGVPDRQNKLKKYFRASVRTEK